MKAYPLYPQRAVIDLAGIWDFAFFKDAVPYSLEFDPAEFINENTVFTKQAVPGCFDATGDHIGKRGVGFYRRSVYVNEPGRVCLKIGAISICGKIFWDGKELAFDDLPYSGVAYEFDAAAGQHELLIAVENRYNTDLTPLFAPNYDFHGFGGILRSIELESLPGQRFGRCTVETIDLSGKVRLDVELPGIKNAVDVDVTIAPYGAVAQSSVLNVRKTLTANENGVASFELDIPGVKLWSVQTPNLYTVTLKMPTDTLIERFGVRTIETKNAKFYLNGEVIQVQGYNRHESHPEFGATLPVALMMEDLQILKSMNCNFVRGCHYPQDQVFLDLCDEMGMLVWEESLGWGNNAEALNYEKFRSKQVEQTALMVRNSRNHPSIILWGFLNECHSHLPECRTLITEMVKTIKDFDTSRPVTFASMMIAYGEQCLDLVDVISCNTYPGWYGTALYCDDPPALIKGRFEEVIREVSTDALKDKPLIISEIGAAALYGCHDRMRIQWTEEFQMDYITEVCNQISGHPRIQGLALWHFADARTYTGGGSLNRARGFNNKGSLDEYRREKLAADAVRKIFAGKLFGDVED